MAQVSNGVTVRKPRLRVLHISIADADFVRFMTHSRSRHPGKRHCQLRKAILSVAAVARRCHADGLSSQLQCKPPGMPPVPVPCWEPSQLVRQAGDLRTKWANPANRTPNPQYAVDALGDP
jgi:hypothetical protein